VSANTSVTVYYLTTTECFQQNIFNITPMIRVQWLLGKRFKRAVTWKLYCGNSVTGLHDRNKMRILLLPIQQTRDRLADLTLRLYLMLQSCSCKHRITSRISRQAHGFLATARCLLGVEAPQPLKRALLQVSRQLVPCVCEILTLN
jgi:hypothetical protein